VSGPTARRLIFALPGDPETRTGGYIYDKRLAEGLRALGWTVESLRLPQVLGRPDAVAHAHAQLVRVPDGVPVMIDGLALGVLPEAAAAVAARGPLIALVHHPLALETGLSRADFEALARSERAALAHANRVVVTSTATAKALVADYGVSRDRIAVALPGVDAADTAIGCRAPFTLLSVGSLTPRKGHAVLLAALSLLERSDWRLRIAGSPRHDPAQAARLQGLAAESSHSKRISFEGEVDSATLARLYRDADLFVLPSFHEGYGMVLAEALARGLPIVATNAGAIPQTVPADAGLLVPPGDPDALAAALERAMGDGQTYAGLRAGAMAARARLPRWDDAARIVADVLERTR